MALRKVSLLILFLLGVQLLCARQIRFVFVSDLHYGLTREFRGREGVSSDEVCRTMADSLLALQDRCFPDDGGVGARERVGAFDFVVCGGDIANRMEEGVQPAAASWTQFERTWYAPHFPILYVLPGNHDISNAIGYTRPLSPARDATSIAQIYNRTMHPAEPATDDTYDYARDRIRGVFVCEGIGFAFAGMWPDSQMRAWLDGQLCDSIPCLLFSHAEPEMEAKRFTNPYGDHSINRTDGFENLVCDTCSVGRKEKPLREYRDMAAFLRRHAEVKAWFHGHTNYNEYYRWLGPDGDLDLPVFRVDSPMKGEVSEGDESQLSFQVVTVDPEMRRMTVREYRWNSTGAAMWGASRTVDL